MIYTENYCLEIKIIISRVIIEIYLKSNGNQFIIPKTTIQFDIILNILQLENKSLEHTKDIYFIGINQMLISILLFFAYMFAI